MPSPCSRPLSVFVLLAFAITTIAPSLVFADPGPSASIPDGMLDAFSYRHIGPVGNRVPSVAGEAGNPNVYYAGAASGGVWKTEDGGTSWKPVFDDQPASSIGSLAIAPSDPNVVWAGTGETFIRGNISIGNGIYQSTDRGETWAHRGLEMTGRIGRIVVHPKNPDIVFAAALGHVYGPQPERGLYRTKDGGDTWEKILFVDEHSGAIDVVMDPNNPRILFAATWQIRVWTAGRESGGPGSGLWTSRDGGDTWTRLEDSGLPDGPWGKIGLAMSPADSKRIYALIETSSNRDFAASEPFQGVLWRSDDGGQSWSMVSADNNLSQRWLYYTRAVVAPDDADEIHFMAVRHTRSIDGGKTTEGVNAGYDHHDLWIDPQNPDRMIAGHDGGVSISTNRGKTWYQPQLPIAQMYHVATDNEIPYNVYGNRQDGPSTLGPSNSLTGGPIPIGAWRSVGGCEVGFALPSPIDSQTVWTGCYDGILTKHDRTSGHTRDVSVWPTAIESWHGADLRYRWQWTFPLALSPHDPNTVYAGSQHLHRTTNGGQSWEEISPDLTTNDPALQQRTGGLTLDDAGPTIGAVLFAIAESPRTLGEIWTGSNDGQVQLSRDSGATWTNLTDNLPDLPPLGTVSNIEPSQHADGTAYLTVDRHQEGDTGSYVYKTDDHGQTWRSIVGDLPQSLFSYAHCVREDPVRPGLLYLGTENAVWVSLDDGAHWHELRSNLPHAPVHWLEVQPHFNDLVVATYGRGFWIADDITPLQQIDTEALESDATLFAPRPAYRFRFKEAPFQQPNDPAEGTNPTYGASIHYWLTESDTQELDDKRPHNDAETDNNDSDKEADEEADAPKIEIFAADGTLIRTHDEIAAGPGLHRIHWDLLSEPTDRIDLRTQPDENPHIPVPDDPGYRGLSDGFRVRYLAPPGTYTVRLTVSGNSFEQPLEVRKDPNSVGTAADIEAQTKLVRHLFDGAQSAAETVNEIEWLRKQIDDLEERFTTDDDSDHKNDASETVASALEQAADLDDALRTLEGHFFDLRLTGAGQDSLRWKRLLYAKMTYLAAGIGGSDFPPTDQQIAVAHELLTELATHKEAMATLRTDVQAFNQVLREAKLDGLVVVVP